MPNGKCRIHGGLTPTGFALPQTKHGRYSKHLPTRLMDRYLEAQSDPDLLALRDEIALLDARLSDVLGRVDTGESGQRWTNVQAAMKAFDAAERTGNVDEMKEALFTLRHEIRMGVMDYAAWDDIRSLLDQRRRTVESERKRLVEMQQTITTERAMLLLAAVADTIRRHVTDRDILAAISAELGRLVATAPRSLPDSAT